MGAKFISPEYGVTEIDNSGTQVLKPTEPEAQQRLQFAPVVADAPICSECGSMMVVNGSCYKCENCGGTSGCS
jgi:ribonucleoside-diphosphate reductase alpha chain